MHPPGRRPAAPASDARTQDERIQVCRPLWSRTVERLALEYPTVTVGYEHVDAASMYLVTDPGRFRRNRHRQYVGDILTDLGAAITGGLGLPPAATSTSAGKSQHVRARTRSAPGPAGMAWPTRRDRPVVALLLDHLGLADQAKRVEAAVAFDWLPAITSCPAAPRDRDALPL